MYRQARRTAIPKVMGILAIVFAFAALCFQLIVYMITKDMAHSSPFAYDSFLGAHDDNVELLRFAHKYLIFSVFLCGLQLAAGITSVTYKRIAPLMMSLYAGIAIIAMIVNVYCSITTADSMGPAFIRVFYDALGALWPATVLILMNLKRVRMACQPSHELAPARMR